MPFMMRPIFLRMISQRFFPIPRCRERYIPTFFGANLCKESRE